MDFLLLRVGKLSTKQNLSKVIYSLHLLKKTAHRLAPLSERVIAGMAIGPTSLVGCARTLFLKLTTQQSQLVEIHHTPEQTTHLNPFWLTAYSAGDATWTNLHR